MSVFIVRPFGTKEGINFDDVEAQLIRPVLDGLNLQGGTTGEIARAGNIQADMMERLLVADLVIADISIHNANVYYELGVRHALRDKPTILIRCSAHDVPFDIKTYRYLEYPKDNPGAAADTLKESVNESLRDKVVDSPVYQLLPDLVAQDPSTFHAVPQEFQEAVAYASDEKNSDVPGLALLAHEAADRPWGISGLRIVGESLFDLEAWPEARRIWETVRADRPYDVQANTLLATVYQRLGDLAQSSLAVDRVLKIDNLPAEHRAEARALAARNLKTQWLERWEGADDTEQRGRLALRSIKLRKTADEYLEAFREDQNHYYSGLNALAFHAIIDELAKVHPDVWKGQFEEAEAAGRALEKIRKKRDRLASAVEMSLESAKERLKRAHKSDAWFDISLADHRYLTKQDRADYVFQGYANVQDTNKVPFAKASAAKQLTFYLDLGLFSEVTRGCLKELGFPEGVRPNEPSPKDRIIISTGHRLDSANREVPRFPANKEVAARDAIAENVRAEVAHAKGDVKGIAGLASGNDILFHEVCKELDVETKACLAIPTADYRQRSVADAGPDWVERFNGLTDELKPYVLSNTDALPGWVADREKYGVFQRGNIWMLEWAFAQPNADVTLIALWNGQEGDGPGGTADMVRLAKERGAKVVIIDPATLESSGGDAGSG